MSKLEFRVRPVTRFTVTAYGLDQGSFLVGEFANEAAAEGLVAKLSDSCSVGFSTDMLTRGNYLRGETLDGGFLVTCPWTPAHASLIAERSNTVYYPAHRVPGEAALFKCMHAVCQDRTTEEYEQFITKGGAISHPLFSRLKEFDNRISEADVKHLETEVQVDALPDNLRAFLDLKKTMLHADDFTPEACDKLKKLRPKARRDLDQVRPHITRWVNGLLQELVG